MKIRWVRIPLQLNGENRNSTFVQIDLRDHERNSRRSLLIEVGHDTSDV